MKKRIVALVICLCLVLSACAKKPADGTHDLPDGQPTTAVTEALPSAEPTGESASEPTSAPTLEPTQEPEAEPTQAPAGESDKSVEGAPITVLTRTENDSEYTDDFERKCYVECDVIALTAYYSSLYPELAAAFKEYSDSETALMHDTLDMLSETYDELLAAGDEYGLHDLMSDEDIVMIRADANLVSFNNSFSEYTGGVHGYYGVIGYTFDTQTGKQLGIKDIVKDTDAFAELVAQQLTDESGEEIMLDLVPDYDLTAYIKTLIEEEALNFTVSDYGVTISFNPYGIGSYAAGIISTTVYFSTHTELFYEKYLSVTDRYVRRLGDNLCIADDFDKDGEAEGICVYGTEMDEFGDYRGITVKSDDSDELCEIDAYGWELDAYLMHTEHGNFLYVESTSDSDMITTYVFKIENTGKVSYLGLCEKSMDEERVYYSDDEYDYDYYKAVTFDPESFRMSGRYDMIGTNFYTGNYRVGDDGMPEILDEYYLFSHPYELTSRVELELEGISTETFMTSDTIVVPAGSIYHMIYTDGVNTVILELEDGRGVVMELDVVNHFGYYGETHLDDIFDGILYAG